MDSGPLVIVSLILTDSIDQIPVADQERVIRWKLQGLLRIRSA